MSSGPPYRDLGGDEPLTFTDDGTVDPAPGWLPGGWHPHNRRRDDVQYMTEAERKAIDRLYGRRRSTRADRIAGVLVWAFLTLALAYLIAHVLVANGLGG